VIPAGGAQRGGGAWDGHYLDGWTAGRQQATLRPMRSGLEITTESGARLWWPYTEVRQTQGFYAGEQVRLERGGELAEAVLVGDPAFLAALHELAPELGRRFHDPGRRRLRIPLTLLAAVAVVAAGAVLYLWILPALATVVADRVPLAWEERLGQAVADQLAPPEARCADPTRARVLDDIVRVLTAPQPAPPYKFRILVADRAVINAFAVPGGYVVVYRGLLERTERAEELAGVLAHELQHVLHRHVTRALVQHASTGLLITALTGDVTGALGYGLEAARTLGRLRYSRQAEEEADADGLRMMVAAGVDPAGMLTFFEKLRKEEKEVPKALTYLSTHPSSEHRVARLRALAAEAPTSATRPLLPGYDWRDIKAICATTGRAG
jgi:Zn-dependent protease with chaperone function